MPTKQLTPWHSALLAAAIAETGDRDRAAEIAAALFAQHPEPIHYADAAGHEHKGDGPGGGQFTGPGQGGSGGKGGGKGNAAPKPKHGERAAKAHAEHGAAKAAYEAAKAAYEGARSKRVETFNEVKEDAEEASDEANGLVDELHGEFDRFSLVGDEGDEGAFSDLDSAIQDYVDDAPAGERFAALKAIELQAMRSMGVKQTKKTTSTPEAQHQAAELTTKINEATKEIAELSKKLDAAAIARDQAAQSEIHDQWNAIASKREKLTTQRDDLARNAGLTHEQLQQNRQHLKQIISHARAARQSLRTYVGHRREMAAIKAGAPMPAPDVEVDPDGTLPG